MTDSLTQELLALEQRWMGAWRDRDRSTLVSLLHPDFALVLSGRPDEAFGRDEWLTQALGAYVCRALDFESPQARAVGGLAVFSAIARQEASINGVDRSGSFFVTDLWTRDGDTGRWQVIARYSSQPEYPNASTSAMRSAAH